MSVIVNGEEFRTLSDEMFIGQKKIYEVWVNGIQVYPDGELVVAFLVDTTGSMSASRAASTISSIYNESGMLYASLIEFKDVTADGKDSTVLHMFDGSAWTDNIDNVLSKVRGLNYTGGGDGPETPHEALLKLSEFAERGTKAYIVTDNDFKDYTDSDGVTYVYDRIVDKLFVQGISVEVRY